MTSWPTQDWGDNGRLRGAHYDVERVVFEVAGEAMVGNLFLPHAGHPVPAAALLGPVAFVKEQAPLQYAARLAQAGMAALIFDPRGHGESAGLPRRFESGRRKTEDLLAALDVLAGRPEVDAARLHAVGICQGVNWVVEAALSGPRLRSIALVAGHYLMPEVAAMYLGSAETVAARIARGAAAAEDFRRTGQARWMPIVAEAAGPPPEPVLLAADPVRMFYLRWADRHPALAHRGYWENRITVMSEAEIWAHRVDLALAKLAMPVLMVHADRAASGPDVPRRLHEAVPIADKDLVWLGGQGQIQFYEDPLTIDLAVAQLTRFFARADA